LETTKAKTEPWMIVFGAASLLGFPCRASADVTERFKEPLADGRLISLFYSHDDNEEASGRPSIVIS
jgi:hypothetical protein